MGLFDFLKKNNNSKFNASAHAVSTTIRGCSIADRLDLDPNTIEAAKHRFIAFDIETTGLSPESDRIVEIGAVLFVDGKEADCFSTLVNPDVPISASASSVNHITNSMLASAPHEDAVYKEFVRFLGDAMSGKTVMCAHNARFDFDFLCNTLSRLGYNARLKYFDTLSLSRRLIKGLENYKQGTLEQYFCLTNKAAHRAESDAEMCGEILCRLVGFAEEGIEEEKAQIEKSMPSDDELEVCAVIQKILASSGKDTSWLGFRKNSSGYVDASCLYTFLKFKFAKKGKYIILKNEAEAINAGLPWEPCPSAEGGTENIRVYFSRPTDIEPYRKLIIQAYQSTYQSLQDYISNSSYTKREAQKWLDSVATLSDDDVRRLIALSEQKEYASVEAVEIEPIITRDMVVVSAVHSRCPLSQIKNLGDWEKGFDEGFKYYERAEEARKAGRFEDALALYDEARFNGYEAPALYDGYALTYHKMKDYDNEIVIIEEFLTRETYGKAGQFEARRSAAIKALYSKQEGERKAREKTLEKERKKKEKEEKAQTKEKVLRGRAICQLDDEGNILAEYESLSQAVEAIGVSSKSIRDAANGVQKHAGGYCWKYKDQFEESN